MAHDIGQPTKPSEMTCEWCGDKATRVYELPTQGRKKLGSARYVYTCPRHGENAENVGAVHRPWSRGQAPVTDF